MDWELRHVEDTEAVLDDSGVYVVVHRIETPETHKEYSGVRVSVRADLMRDSTKCSHLETDEPIMSFAGSANAVRKALIRFVGDYHNMLPHQGTPISREHAAYIGYELHRAESTPGFVQD